MPHCSLGDRVRHDLTYASAKDVPQLVEREVWNLCSSQRGLPSCLDRADQPVRTNQIREKKRAFRSLFLFPRLQCFAGVLGKRSGFQTSSTQLPERNPIALPANLEQAQRDLVSPYNFGFAALVVLYSLLKQPIETSHHEHRLVIRGVLHMCGHFVLRIVRHPHVF